MFTTVFVDISIITSILQWKNSVHRVSDKMWQGKNFLVVESVRACFMEAVTFGRALTDKQGLVSR